MPTLLVILVLLVFIFWLVCLYESHKTDEEIKRSRQESNDELAKLQAQFIQAQTDKINEIEVFKKHLCTELKNIDNLIQSHAHRNSTPTGSENDIPKPREDGQA